MSAYVLGLQDIDKTTLMAAGGKGANLGELAKIAGIHVPAGFCITTDAFQRIIEESPAIHTLIDQLSRLTLQDREQISTLSAELRRGIAETTIPPDVRAEISRFHSALGANTAYAVRSSATAEDLPTASFAGQQDTYLNVIGEAAILTHISKCWASLFTERAIIYRLQNGFEHRNVRLAVIVQQMVFPQAAGIAFTADPVTANRKVLSIDASFGLGEALVSGLVNADVYKVRDGTIIEKQIATKRLAIHAMATGGTQQQALAREQQSMQTLTDEQIVQLERIGRTMEAHFGQPQDIEWCLADGTFFIVQSRPITTLFPIPEADDQGNHVYVSVGHQQMMTDPIRPLGLSFFLLVTSAPMRAAGGRLFVDITSGLASPVGRRNLLDSLGTSDPLIKDALMTIIERGDFIQTLASDGSERRFMESNKGISAGDIQAQAGDDPAIVTHLIEQSQAGIGALQHDIQAKAGSDVFDYILENIQELKTRSFTPQNLAVIRAPMNAAFWLNEHMEAWLGEKNVADTLSLSIPNNVTSEMGLALLDVADVIRPHPAIVAYLQQAQDDAFLDGLTQFEGGQEARDAILAYLDAYGMRCVGEIDITRTRWAEKPSTLIPLLLSNIHNFAPGASRRKFEQGRQEALAKAQGLLARLRQLPDGEHKAEDTQRMITIVRNFAGYREYPKYAIVSRYWLYKQALLKEAERLVQAGVIRERDDISYLSFEELREVVRTHRLDADLINERKAVYAFYDKLKPPRVITSDGEIITGAYKRDNLPAGAIAGLPVSAGMIEGRARVILRIEDAKLEEGDILVTPFTDPSWTPLFVSIKGLVTEVGGLMTHGAVIAREYGLPAVVGVENATNLIKDGQRIRVNGTDGYVEML